MADRERLGRDVIEEAIHYHLDSMRRFGAGWRAPQVRRHRESVIALVQVRRLARRIEAADVA